ncbi:unnamed protein product [Brassica oleracea]
MDQKTIDDRFLLQRLLRMIRLLRIQPMDAAAGASVLLRVRKPMRRKKQRMQMLRLRGRRRLRLRKKLLRIRKKRLNLRKKEAEAKKTVAEAKKKEAELKKKQEAELKKQKQAGSNSLADITDEVVAEQNECAPESDVENSEVVRSAIIKDYREKNVRILIHERPWPENEYGWVFDNHVVAYMSVLIKRSMRGVFDSRLRSVQDETHNVHVQRQWL